MERLGFCEVIVFAREAGAGATARPLGGGERHWLYEAYVLADRRWFGRDDDALAPVSSERCGGDSTRRVELRGEWASASNTEAIAAEDLDVLLCLAPDVPADRLAGCARFGAWCLYAGGVRGRAGEAQLFWQMYDADVAPITLRTHTSADGERTIYRSVVEADQVSLHRSRCRAARRAAHLAARRLRDLHRQGWPFITSLPLYAERHSSPEPGRSRPTNGMTARFLWRVASGVLSRRLAGRLGEKQWFIAYRRIGGEASADGDSARLTMITPPAGRFYADPFLFRRHGRRFIFFEDYEWSRRRAVICYVEIDAGGRHRSPRVAMSQDCHLSYPFVFDEGGAVFMLPETAGRRTVELYRAVRFPDEWRLDRVLLRDVAATDATLLRYEGRLWLFVAIAVDGGRPIDELFLFSSESLHGEWEPHPMNPVVSDVRSARPAGRVFRQDGHLIRPAQDCSRSYGWRLVFNRVETLSATDYREQPIGAIEPAHDSGNLRTHSYDSDGTYEVLDGFRMRPRFPLRGISRARTPPRWHRVDLESPGRERSILHS
jgi:hypothetical protein